MVYGLSNILPLGNMLVKQQVRTNLSMQPLPKKASVVFRLPTLKQRRPCTASKRLEVVGDSKLIVNCVNGIWVCKYATCRPRLALTHGTPDCLRHTHGVCPRHACVERCRHVFRELTCEADQLAGRLSRAFTSFSDGRAFTRY